jgi:nitrate reductase gamma subunit
MDVDAWIEFGRGPLFRLAFSLTVLGLLRIFVLTVLQIVEAYSRTADKNIPWKDVLRQTAAWLVPVGRLWRKRPAYSSTSVLFHFGLLTVPFLLAAHIHLWKSATGFAWPALPREVADVLTLAVIITGMGLFASRVIDCRSRALSRAQDYLWPVLLVIPFASGYLCSQASLGPSAYRQLMLVHIYSGNLILILIPFTKIAHCVLAPLSQIVTAVAWKFVPAAGERVAATLGYADRPSWVERSRTGGVVERTGREEASVK